MKLTENTDQTQKKQGEELWCSFSPMFVYPWNEYTVVDWTCNTPSSME